MDAQELPEALNPSQLPPPAAVPPGSCRDDCLPANCRPACSLEVVCALLADIGGITGQEADCLLDLHHLLGKRHDAEATLRLCCELRRRMEHRHYLAFYRLRRWLENHIVAEVRPSPDAQPLVVPVRLNGYCVEALRRLCLCAALQEGISLNAPRLVFKFTPLPKGSIIKPVLSGPPGHAAPA